MYLYHGTNENCIDSLVDNGFFLFSKENLLKRKIPLLSGELVASNNHGLISIHPSIYHVSLSNNIDYSQIYSSLSFDTKYISEMAQNFKMSLDGKTNHLDYMPVHTRETIFGLLKLALDNYESKSALERMKMTKSGPLTLALECNIPDDLGIVDFKNQGSEKDVMYIGSVHIKDNIRYIYSKNPSEKIINFANQLNVPLLELPVNNI
ncbi:MAG: hypothetical protein ACP5NV_06240 [Candidatus Woesearchaeota archaeon]